MSSTTKLVSAAMFVMLLAPGLQAQEDSDPGSWASGRVLFSGDESDQDALQRLANPSFLERLFGQRPPAGYELFGPDGGGAYNPDPGSQGIALLFLRAMESERSSRLSSALDAILEKGFNFTFDLFEWIPRVYNGVRTLHHRTPWFLRADTASSPLAFLTIEEQGGGKQVLFFQGHSIEPVLDLSDVVELQPVRGGFLVVRNHGNSPVAEVYQIRNSETPHLAYELSLEASSVSNVFDEHILLYDKASKKYELWDLFKQERIWAHNQPLEVTYRAESFTIEETDTKHKHSLRRSAEAEELGKMLRVVSTIGNAGKIVREPWDTGYRHLLIDSKNRQVVQEFGPEFHRVFNSKGLIFAEYTKDGKVRTDIYRYATKHVPIRLNLLGTIEGPVIKISDRNNVVTRVGSQILTHRLNLDAWNGGSIVEVDATKLPDSAFRQSNYFIAPGPRIRLEALGGFGSETQILPWLKFRNKFTAESRDGILAITRRFLFGPRTVTSFFSAIKSDDSGVPVLSEFRNMRDWHLGPDRLGEFLVVRHGFEESLKTTILMRESGRVLLEVPGVAGIYSINGREMTVKGELKDKGSYERRIDLDTGRMGSPTCRAILKGR